jgi:hypothetical protein
MKLHEIALTEEQLDEARLRHALAAAGLAGALALSGSSGNHTDRPVQTPSPHITQSTQAPRVQGTTKQHIAAMTDAILDKYDVNPNLAHRVATTAKKYEYPNFPKAEDILAITGVESSFDPTSKSGLQHDPALGLMQVRPGIWNLSPRALSTIDKQIKVGATILHSYYQKLGSVEAAVHAYNIGLTNYRHQTNLNPNYVNKYSNERKIYSNIM